MLAGRVIEHGQIEASLTSSAHECVGAFKDRGAIPARAREQERRQIGALGFEGRQARPPADALIGHRRQARAERSEVPDRVEAGGAPEPVGASLEERREAERAAGREDPDADATRIDPEILGPASDKGDRGSDIVRSLGALESVRRAVIEWNADEATRGEVLAVGAKDAPVLRGRDDLLRRVAVDQEHDRARAPAGWRPVDVEPERAVSVGPVDEIALDISPARWGKHGERLENSTVKRHQAFSP